MLKFGVIDYVSTIYKTTESYLFVGIGFEGGGYVLGGGCCLWVAWVFLGILDTAFGLNGRG